jgi:hypothetical protein
MALLACVGVDEEDFREVVAVGRPVRRRERPTPRCCGVSSTGAYAECA